MGLIAFSHHAENSLKNACASATHLKEIAKVAAETGDRNQQRQLTP